MADYDAKKRTDAEARKRDRDRKALQARISHLEGRITEREQEIARLEAAMSEPGFYEDREKSKVVVDRHQELMWDVGDLMWLGTSLSVVFMDHSGGPSILKLIPSFPSIPVQSYLDSTESMAVAKAITLLLRTPFGGVLFVCGALAGAAGVFIYGDES